MIKNPSEPNPSQIKRKAGPFKPDVSPNPRHGSLSGDLRHSEQPLASPRWLAASLLGVLVLAVVCVYATLCLLLWQGQWQIVFGPPQPVKATPSAAGLQYDDIHFDATETGVLQLNGWWIPADAGSRATSNPSELPTILFLRDGSGSLSDSLGELQALHALGINLFAFDYRGFGSSVKIHPSESSVSQDALAAWRYLTTMRRISPGSIVIYGVRLGAAVAAETSFAHPQAPAVILEDPQPPVLERLVSNPRTKLLPVRLLFRDRFDPSQTLARMATPKLFLATGHAAPLYFDVAADPKSSAVLASTNGGPLYNDPSYATAIEGFLKKHLPQSSH